MHGPLGGGGGVDLTTVTSMVLELLQTLLLDNQFIL